jgi:hypothetical protein
MMRPAPKILCMMVVLAMLLPGLAAGAALAQNAGPPAGGPPNYTKLLETAKQAAMAMTEKYEALRAGIRQASSPEAARKLLDEMQSSGEAALAPYQRTSELMAEVDGLLKFIKSGREEAEEYLKKS